MKIIILGAGQVGTTLANSLANELHDITIVDVNHEKLEQLSNRFELRTVTGRGSYPPILRQAGIEDTDMLIAVTDSDETNILACYIAHTYFRTPKRIARIRSQRYLDEPDFINKLHIDLVISPEQLVTDSIRNLIEYPGALHVLDFAEGHLRLVAFIAYTGGTLVGHTIATMAEQMPQLKARVVAIYRHNQPIKPTGDTLVAHGDEVFILVARGDLRELMKVLRRLDKEAKSIIIAGGGNIGKRLALTLEKQYHVKVIERDRARAAEIYQEFTNAMVLVGDGSDDALLKNENIASTDIFCALTDYDEFNIISAIMAKKMGAKQVMALINRSDFGELFESGYIDIVISPKDATLSALLSYVRRGDIENVHTLRNGAAEAIEAIAHGDKNTSKVVGRVIEEISLPKGAYIGAIARGDDVLMAHHDTVIESGDHLVIFLNDKSGIKAIERLFQVDFTFL
ncbi:MAG: Trk system potassium transporter TrkA [Gammaproteobacteria bacterium]|nr:Trk system potassium transporter TrkA [Gammaproteobacteria bacterium]